MPNPKDHVKPTPEELEAQAKAAIEEAEKLAAETPTEEEEEVVTPEVEVEAESEEAPNEEQGQDEEQEDAQADPSEAAKDKLKSKLSASARENQKIYAKNRIINQALVEADGIPEPTEEEMVKEYDDWDVMSETERKFAKETIISRNWRKVISQAKEQATKIEKWNESVETYVDDPATLVDNPELEGKVDDFRTFATEDSNNSVPFNILVSAFLHEQSKNKTSNKGKMFERGSGGPNDKPQIKSDKISLEEARQLKANDYPAWVAKVKAGKIDLEI